MVYVLILNRQPNADLYHLVKRFCSRFMMKREKLIVFSNNIDVDFFECNIVLKKLPNNQIIGRVVQYLKKHFEGEVCFLTNMYGLIDFDTSYLEQLDYSDSYFVFSSNGSPIYIVYKPSLRMKKDNKLTSFDELENVLSSTMTKLCANEFVRISDSSWGNVKKRKPQFTQHENELKVFGIGLQRTGTSSLRKALNILGINTQEIHGSWYFAKPDNNSELQFVPSPNANFFNGFADNPLPLFYKHLDKMYPNGKFILTTRAVDLWLKSVSAFFDRNDWSKFLQGDKIQMCHLMLYGDYTYDRDSFMQAYKKHESDVRSYFKNKQNFLTLDINDSFKWNKLCSFLQVEIPSETYPYVNVSHY